MNTNHLFLILAVLALFHKLTLAQDNAVTKVENWEFDDEGLNAKLSSTIELSYLSNGNLERRFSTTYNRDGIAKWFGETLYSYFENGCIDQIKYIGSEELTIVYHNEKECRIDSSITSYINFAGEWKFFNKYEYLYDPLYEYLYDPLQITIRNYGFSDSSWLYEGESIREENANGQLLRFWTPISDFADEEEFNFTYDDNNNVTTEEYYVKYHNQDKLFLTRRTNYTNTYNDINQLSLIEIESIHYDQMGEVDFSFNYKMDYLYYCDDLLKEERTFLFNEAVTASKRYYYNLGTDCEEPESHKLYITPNPVSNFLTIESQALFNKECEIWILDTKGSLVQNVDFVRRTSSIDIDLTTLSSGLYYVIVNWQSGRSSKKFVKI